MTKILGTIAALTIIGAAVLPLPASAAEQKPGISKESTQSTDVSARRRYYRHRYYVRRHYWGPRYYARPYWGPRYGYYDYGYPYYGYRNYYRPGLAFGIGPFGFGIF